MADPAFDPVKFGPKHCAQGSDSSGIPLLRHRPWSRIRCSGGRESRLGRTQSEAHVLTAAWDVASATGLKREDGTSTALNRYHESATYDQRKANSKESASCKLWNAHALPTETLGIASGRWGPTDLKTPPPPRFVTSGAFMNLRLRKFAGARTKRSTIRIRALSSPSQAVARLKEPRAGHRPTNRPTVQPTVRSGRPTIL